MNKEATVVVVGIYNPLTAVRIDEESLIAIGDAACAITGTVNQELQKLATKFGAGYADITNIETGGVAMDATISTLAQGGGTNNGGGIATHPSAEGNHYIGRQILAQLPAEEKSVTKDIIVDLGPVESVGLVIVDRSPVSEFLYDEETHRLTVPYSYGTHKLLTVTTVQDGKVYVAVYQLSWDDDTGYSAYRLYYTHNAILTIKNLAKKCASVFKTLSGIVRR